MTAPKRRDQLQKLGRKSEFRPEFILVARAMTKLGATSADIAEELDVGIATIYNWRAKYPEFLEAIKDGKDAADNRTERSLFERANGIAWPATKVLSDGTVVKYTEHYPPDVGAIAFWLKNRRPDKWRDVHNIEAEMGHYVISERPLSEREWIELHASNADEVLASETSPVVPSLEGKPKGD